MENSNALAKPPNVLKGRIITIDGPAGAGKGTLAKSLAYHYRMKYLDTGTLYRALAYKVTLMEGDPTVEAHVIRAFEHFDYDFRHVGNNQFCTFLDGQDVSAEIRTMGAGANASYVAKMPAVRALLKQFQVDFAEEWRQKVGVILDGRDTGTEICPQADYKFFVDASPEVRAQRRLDEMIAAGHPDSFENILANIKHRDDQDRNRAAAPLRPADDAILVDTSHLSISDVLKHVAGHLGVAPALAIE